MFLPDGFSGPYVVMPGVLAVKAPAFKRLPERRPYRPGADCEAAVKRFCEAFTPADWINQFPLVVLVDDSDFAARTLSNFLWVTFTRSNPAADVHGVATGLWQKHWGCEGSLVIDARIKPHHAPPLEEDPAVSKRVDALAAPGGPLHRII
jgi:4-hydroxy-3-polyprenylbenzoate decarboxylase